MGDGEVAYTADIGITQFHQRVGGFKDDKPQRPELAHSSTAGGSGTGARGAIS